MSNESEYYEEMTWFRECEAKKVKKKNHRPKDTRPVLYADLNASSKEEWLDTLYSLPAHKPQGT